MPYVNIKITKEGVTAEQKQKLIQGATDLLVDVLGKNPKTTVVVIDEVTSSIMYTIRSSLWFSSKLLLTALNTGFSKRTNMKNKKIPPAGMWSIAR